MGKGCGTTRNLKNAPKKCQGTLGIRTLSVARNMPSTPRKDKSKL
jgi:hypothetical protein